MLTLSLVLVRNHRVVLAIFEPSARFILWSRHSSRRLHVLKALYLLLKESLCLTSLGTISGASAGFCATGCCCRQG